MINLKKQGSLFHWLYVWICLFGLTSLITACGKGAITNASNLNIKYQVINLSPDLGSINLYIRFLKVNTTPFYFAANQGYFFVTALDTPYFFKSALVTGGPALLSRPDLLKTGATYSLFITGDVSTNTIKQIFTVDTASLPALGRGKLRFVNASPSGTSGFDIYANGTKIFSDLIYPKFSGYIEIPNGNYDLQVNTTGSSTILKTLVNVPIQDGRLYTLYTYGYTTRTDSAAFNAAIITNR